MTSQAWTLRPNLIATDIAESTVTLDIDAAVYYGLETTGRRIWQLLEEPQTVASLVAVLTDEYDVSEEACTGSVTAFLAELEGLNLIVSASAPT